MSPRGPKSDETDTAPDAPDDTAIEIAHAGRVWSDDETRLQDILDTLPPDTITKLKRQDPMTKQWIYLRALSPEEVSTEWIGNKFGGGVYHVSVMYRDAKLRRSKIKAQGIWRIEGEYKPPAEGLPQQMDALGRITQEGSPPLGMAPAPGAPMQPRELLDAAMTSRLLELAKGNTGPDWAGIAAMVTALGALVGPGIAQLLKGIQKPADDGVRVQLEAMQAEMRALRDKPSPQAGQLSEALKGVRDVLELREALSDAGGGERGGTLDEIVKRIPDVLSAFAQRGQPAPVSPASPDVQLMPANLTPWQQLLLPHRDNLIMVASNGWEPAYTAGLIANMLPADQTGLAMEYLQQPDPVAILNDVIPEMRAFALWTPQLIAALKVELLDTAETTDDGDDPETPDDDAD